MTDLPLAAPAPTRASTYERDRKTRQRRTARLDAMRATVAALERAVPVVLTLHDSDSDVPWDGFLDANALRVRRLMLQSLALTKEAQVLQASQRQLQRLLREHRLASLVLSGLLGAEPRNDWETDVQRWRQLTRRHFTPWTLWDCADEIDDALKEIHALLYHATATPSTGASSFHGWRERRVVDKRNRSLRFVFQKDYYGVDMTHFAHGLWMLYTSESEGARGSTTRRSVEIVQQLSPTMCIIRSNQRFPTFDAHLLYLLFRVEKDGGFTLCVRTIYDSDLQTAINGPHDVWVTNDFWFHWEPHSDNVTNFRGDVGGHIVGMDIHNANQWLVEVLVSLVRGEALLARQPLLMIENPMPEDSQSPTAAESTSASVTAITTAPLATSYVLWQRQVRADTQ